MEPILLRSLPLCFLCMILLPQAISLTCYECQERRAGEWCSSPKKRECNSATSICLKYVHKEGKPGFPNHVIAKCDLRSYHTQNKINACELSVRNRNGALTVSETCTCDTDLCNDATLGASKMVQAKGNTKMPVTTASSVTADQADADEHEATDDEAVESHSPEVKHAEKESSEEKEKASNGASKTISQVYNALALVGLQLVFLCSVVSLRY